MSRSKLSPSSLFSVSGQKPERPNMTPDPCSYASTVRRISGNDESTGSVPAKTGIREPAGRYRRKLWRALPRRVNKAFPWLEFRKNEANSDDCLAKERMRRFREQPAGDAADCKAPALSISAASKAFATITASAPLGPSS
jgi:hypothetical protein